MSAQNPDVRTCNSCGHELEMPALFCDRCGVARLRLGHWRLTINLSLSMLAFLGTYWLRSDHFFQDYVLWDVPVFVLYSFFFLQFMLALVAGLRRKSLLVAWWFLLFFGAAILFNEYQHRYDSSFVFSLLEMPDEYAAQYPLYFYSGLAAVLLLLFVPAYVRWGRAFGWVMAYRVVLLSLLALAVAAMLTLAMIAWVWRQRFFPHLTPLLDPLVQVHKPNYDRALLFFAVTVGRIFLVEIFVFASIHSYALVRIKPLAPPAGLGRERAFVRSLILIAHGVRRVGHKLEQMIRYLAATLIQLGRDLSAVIRVFIRDFFVPVLAMTAAFVLIGLLVGLTRSYNEENRLLDAGRIAAGVLGLIASAIIFLGCKTRLHWGRIVVFFMQLIAWLLPNLLIFFVLVSVSLWASSAALSRFDLPEELPFRVGLLTKVTLGLLIVLVVFILIRKRSLFAASPGESVAPALLNRPDPPAASPPVEKQKTNDKAKEFKKEGSSHTARLYERVQGKPVWGKIRSVVSSVGQQTGELKGKIGGLVEQIQLKPPSVEQFEQAQRRYEEKLAQFQALQAAKGTIQPEIYQQLAAKYPYELKELASERDRLRLVLEARRAQKMRENAELEQQLAALQNEQAQYEQLRDAGALGEPDLQKKTAALRREMGRLTVQLETGKAMIAALTVDEPLPEKQETTSAPTK